MPLLTLFMVATCTIGAIGGGISIGFGIHRGYKYVKEKIRENFKYTLKLERRDQFTFYILTSYLNKHYNNHKTMRTGISFNMPNGKTKTFKLPKIGSKLKIQNKIWKNNNDKNSSISIISDGGNNETTILEIVANNIPDFNGFITMVFQEAGATPEQYQHLLIKEHEKID